MEIVMNNIFKNKKVILGVLAIVFAIVGTGCIGSAEAAAPVYETERIEIGDLSANIVENGTVRPNRTQEITWETSGIVETVKVNFLSAVTAGEQLAALQESSLPQSVILAEVDLIDARNELEELQSSDLNSEEAYLALVQAEEELADLQDERYLLDYERCSESTIDNQYADYLIAKDNYERQQSIFDLRYAHLAEDDLERANALTNLTVAKEEYERAWLNLEYCRSEGTDSEITEKDAEIAVAKAKLDDTQREWKRLMDGPDPDDIATLEQQIMAFEATLAQAYLTAPFDGVIVDSNVEPGDKVTSGLYAFEVEDQTHLYVDVDVSEIDINRVSLGQEVTLVFDAIYGQEYLGEVVKIGATGTEEKGIVSFEVTIELLNPDENIKPGMTASAYIQVDKVEEALLIPNRAIRVSDGERVVFVLDNNDTEPQAVPIVLGVTDGVMSQVLSGDLEAGDQVVLNPDILFETDDFEPGQGPGSM
jgi:HlyD family secretion protein